MFDLRLYGHRGAPAERPENTLPSFARALEIGVDVLETDAHMTADGHVVLSHDPSGERLAGVAQLICQTRLADVQRWDVGRRFRACQGGDAHAGGPHRVPTLSEALAAFPEARWNIDLKQRDPPIVGALLDVLRRHDAERRVTLASFHTSVIRAVRAAGFQGATALSQRETLAFVGLPDALVRRTGDHLQIPIGVGPVSLASRRFIRRAHRHGLRVEYWTIDDPVEAEVLLDRGADGIFTDDPAALAPVFARVRHRRGQT